MADKWHDVRSNAALKTEASISVIQKVGTMWDSTVYLYLPHNFNRWCCISFHSSSTISTVHLVGTAVGAFIIATIYLSYCHCASCLLASSSLRWGSVFGVCGSKSEKLSMSQLTTQIQAKDRHVPKPTSNSDDDDVASNSVGYTSKSKRADRFLPVGLSSHCCWWEVDIIIAWWSVADDASPAGRWTVHLPCCQAHSNSQHIDVAVAPSPVITEISNIYLFIRPICANYHWLARSMLRSSAQRLEPIPCQLSWTVGADCWSSTTVFELWFRLYNESRNDGINRCGLKRRVE